MNANPAPELPEYLPALRDDLHLHESAPNADGSPGWTIQDPVNNIFYRIGWLEFELLSRWHLATPSALLAAAQTETLLEPTDDELLALIAFLHEHHLLAIHSPAYTEQLLARYRRSTLTRAQWLLHHYLFFRIPLWHPERWLRLALPWVQWIFNRSTAYAIVAVCVLGLFLTARQIDVFVASFAETLSPGGLAGYLLALAIAKSLHELGHAFTATRHGVRVAHMGVAFLVMWPMLYTDTAESWRLKHRQQRLEIASAGILAELALAGLATLAWALAEPGDLRQALFFLAATSWVISLGLNASPFMRFDGYFILSDLVDLPNLHERSFALARTWMRNLLLGWNDPDPEEFSPHRRRWLIAFALTTWLYRLVMFVGIAVAVYLMFFKLLGIFLFLVEIIWFVLRPLNNELKVWRERQSEIQPSRRRLAGLAAGALLLLTLIPWNLSVTATAWAHGAEAHALYSPRPARVGEISALSGPVSKEALIITLDQPESDLRATMAQVAENALSLQLAGLGNLTDGEDRRPILEQQRAVKIAEAGAEADETERLKLRAPVAGQLLDMDADVRPGVWVSPQQPLAIVVNPDQWIADAYVSQQDQIRIKVGNTVRFYPEDDPLFPVKGEVVEVDHHRAGSLPHPMLSARFGGPLAVLQDQQGLTPRDALYRVRIRFHEPLDRLAVRRGSALIDASPRSWLVEAAKTVMVVLIREATF